MSRPWWLVSSLAWNTKVACECGNFLTNHQHPQMDNFFEPYFHFQTLWASVDSWQRKNLGNMLAHPQRFKGISYKASRLTFVMSGQHSCTFFHRVFLVSSCVRVRAEWSSTSWRYSHVVSLVATPCHFLYEVYLDATWYSWSMLQSSWSGRSHTSLLLWCRKHNGFLLRVGLAPCE